MIEGRGRTRTFLGGSLVYALVARRGWVRGVGTGCALTGAGALLAVRPNLVFFLQNFQAIVPLSVLVPPADAGLGPALGASRLGAKEPQPPDRDLYFTR